MKRFIPPILLGGFIVALFVAIQGGAPGLAGQKDPASAEPVTANLQAALQGYECIAIVHGDVSNEAIVLQTPNFGFDYVVVVKPEFFCETALKFPSGSPEIRDPEEVRILVCYSIRRGDDPDDPITLDTISFSGNDGGPAGDQVDVRRATIMCEEGTKRRFIRGDGFDDPVGTTDTVAIWECFTLEKGEVPNQRALLVTDNFGPDEVIILGSNLMCEPAQKFLNDNVGTTAGVFPDEPVLQCYTLQGGVSLEEQPLILETGNFGDDRVDMRNGSKWCEPAVKTSYIVDFEITLPTIPAPAP